MLIQLKFMLCFLSAFALAMLIIPLCLKMLSRLKAQQTILKYVESHQNKQGTATMGGLIFLIALSIIGLIFIWDISSEGSICIFITLSYGLLGFLDDYIKIKNKQNEGLKAYQKIIGQAGIAIIVSIYCYNNPNIGSEIMIPFSNKVIDLGWGYIPFCIFVYIAMTNAVNLTDGLDGLVTKTSGVSVLFFIVVILMQFFDATKQGDIIAQINLQSLMYFSTALLGSIVAFAWVNTNPAKIFMGDTGSLALGGAITCLGIFLKNPLILGLVGIMYVVSCISVIVQVISFIITKKRVFLMAPLHHHFEKKGIKETKIVSYYTIITIIFGVIALISYFL